MYKLKYLKYKKKYFKLKNKIGGAIDIKPILQEIKERIKNNKSITENCTTHFQCRGQTMLTIPFLLELQKEEIFKNLFKKIFWAELNDHTVAIISTKNTEPIEINLETNDDLQDYIVVDTNFVFVNKDIPIFVGTLQDYKPLWQQTFIPDRKLLYEKYASKITLLNPDRYITI